MDLPLALSDKEHSVIFLQAQIEHCKRIFYDDRAAVKQ